MKKLFVSSTFKDMQAERDALRDYVSARINAEARKHGDEIEFCDLRWGIDTSDMEEEESSRKVLNVCFREIDRCETPFIILLGYRYGWIPDAATVKKATDEVKMELDQLEKSVTALEIEYGSVLKQKKTLVYERVIVNEDYPEIYHSEDPAHQEKLEELKQRIRNLTDSKIRTYDVHFRRGKPLQADIRNFSDMVFHDLNELMKPDWDHYDALPQVQKKQMAAWNYIREKGKLFTARMHDAEKCLEILEKGSDQVLVCMGDPGSGKSTLASHIALALKERAQVLPVIGGLTPEDTDSFAIIRKSVKFLENLLEIHNDDIQTESGEIDKYAVYEARMRELAGILPEGTVIYIIIDALDQFNDSRYRDRLGFIPKGLPHNIHYFITCTKDLRLPETAVYVPEGLNAEDRKLIIGSVLERAGKELHKTVKEEIIQMKGSDQPLYISLMMQRLMIMNSSDFNAIDSAGLEPNEAIAAQQKKIIHASSENLSELAAQVLTDVGRRINPALCTQILQFIAVSRYGLRPSDLALLCKENWEAADFTLLIHSLADDFIVRDDGRYDFMHQSIRTGIRNTLNKPAFISVDQKILKMMQSLPQDDPIRQSELIYHALRCRSFDNISNYMSRWFDYNDIVYRKAAHAVYDFMIDYGAENVRELVTQTKSNGTLLMLSEGVPRFFSGESSSCNMMCSILTDIYDTVSKAPEDDRDVKKVILIHCASNIAKLGEWSGRTDDCKAYSVKFLKYAKKSFDSDNKKDRVGLLHAYYSAMQSMRNSTDENELTEAIRIGEEGDRLFDKQTDRQLLEENNRLYAIYYYTLAFIYGKAGEPLKEAQANSKFRTRAEELYKRHPTKLNAYTRNLIHHSAGNAMLMKRGMNYDSREKKIEYLLNLYNEKLAAVRAVENDDLTEFPSQLADRILNYEHLATCKEEMSSENGMADDVREMFMWNIKAIDDGIRQVSRTDSEADAAILKINLNEYIRRLAENPSGLPEAEGHIQRWLNGSLQRLKINPSLSVYETAARITMIYADLMNLTKTSKDAVSVICRSLDTLQNGMKKGVIIIKDIDRAYQQCLAADKDNLEVFIQWHSFSLRYGKRGGTMSAKIQQKAFDVYKNASDPLRKAMAIKYGKQLIDLKIAEFENQKSAEIFETLISTEVKVADIIETLDFFHPLRRKYIKQAVQTVNNHRKKIRLDRELRKSLMWQNERLPAETKYNRRNLVEFIRLYRLGKPAGTEKLSEYLIYHPVFIPADQKGTVKEVFSSPVELLLGQIDSSKNPSYDAILSGDLMNQSFDSEMVLDPGTDHSFIIDDALKLIIKKKYDELLKEPTPELKKEMMRNVRETVKNRKIRNVILCNPVSRLALGEMNKLIRSGKLHKEEPFVFVRGKKLKPDTDDNNGILFTYRGLYSSFWANRLIRYDEILDYSSKKGRILLELKNDFEVVIEVNSDADDICRILGIILKTINEQ